MEITTTKIHGLNWDFPGANEFNATITNGRITELRFRDVGDLTNSELCSINEKYLRNIHKALTGLFQHIDDIRNIGSIQVEQDIIEAESRIWNQMHEKIKPLQHANINGATKDFDDKIRFVK